MNRKLIVIILVVGAAVRLWLVFTAAGINADAHKYAMTSVRMAEQGVVSGMRGGFFWPYYPVNRRLVTYPFLGSLFYRVIGDPVLSLRLVSALSGVALIWLLYAVVKELFEDEGVATLAAALIALHPEFTRASAAVYREVLMACLLTLAFLLLLRGCRQRSRWPAWALGCGAVLFAAFLTRPDAAAALGAFGLIALFLFPKIAWRRRLATAALMVAVFCIFEAPYALWLRKETGYWLVNQWQIQRKMSPVGAATEFLLREHVRPSGPVE